MTWIKRRFEPMSASVVHVPYVL